MHKKIGKGQDSNPRPSVWQTSKNLKQPLCTSYISVAVSESQLIKLIKLLQLVKARNQLVIIERKSN